MNARTTTLLGAAAVAAALALSGCSGAAGSGATAAAGPNVPTGDEVSTTVDEQLTALLPADIVEKGRLDVAIDIPYPPMARYGEGNRELGFDPELARLLGQKLGIDVSLNKQAFDSVIPSLQADKNDLIMSGMNDTPEREKTVSYVDYTYGGFAIVVPDGNPKGIGTQQDLCGKTVSIQKATAQGELLRTMDCDGDPVNVTELPSDLDAQTALRAGKSDAYVADALVAGYVADTVDGGDAFDLVSDPVNPNGFSPVYSGIGILKDETELIEAVRQALQALIDEGTYQQVLDRNSLGAYGVESAEVNLGAQG